jgi:hypothetical protein
MAVSNAFRGAEIVERFTIMFTTGFSGSSFLSAIL